MASLLSGRAASPPGFARPAPPARRSAPSAGPRGTGAALWWTTVAASVLAGGTLHPLVKGVAGTTTSLDRCPAFVQTLYPEPPNADQLVKQWAVRKKNVDDMVRAHPDIRRFNVLYYKRDWKTVTDLFKALNLKMNPDGYKSKGQWSRWATLLMTLAWQKRFGKECLVTLEDDVKIPADFSTRLGKVQLRLDVPEIVKFSSWGEGYASNLPMVDRAMGILFEKGVGYKGNSDQFINSGAAGELRTLDVGIEKLVATNQGNIMHVEGPGFGDLSSEGIHEGDMEPWQMMMTGASAVGGFKSGNASDANVDLAGNALAFATGRLRSRKRKFTKASNAPPGSMMVMSPHAAMSTDESALGIMRHSSALVTLLEATDFGPEGAAVVDLAGAAAHLVARLATGGQGSS